MSRMILDITTKMLERQGYTVLAAATPGRRSVWRGSMPARSTCS